MNKGLVYWLAFCFLIISGLASAADKVPVVWDGFAYPYKPGAPEKCDEKLNPSCAILFDSNNDKDFWEKVEKIKDAKYKFVSSSNEAGDSLHVAVSVGLEWIIKGTGNSDDEYYFCANVILYNATGNKLNLVNSKPNCWHQRMKAEDKADLRGFLQKFIFDTSKTAQTVEKRLLAEMSEIINNNSNDLIRLKLGTVTSSAAVFANEPAKKDLLNYYVAELFSSYASNALGRPIIPASTSTGLLDLRFAATNRRSSISLPLATHIIDLHIHPFGKNTYKENNFDFELSAAYIRINHKSDEMDSLIRDVNFGISSAPRRVIKDLLDSEEMKNLILLDQLIEETSNQLAKPNKEWLKQHVVKNSLDKVLPGFEALSRDLKK
jgi:hypothetical protein